jgi:lauroyl/myristoyl acyltransferase
MNANAEERSGSSAFASISDSFAVEDRSRMVAMSPWKRFRYWLEEGACRGLAWFIPKLSRRASVSLARWLGAVAFCVDRRGRRVALENLECVFGDQLTAAKRAAIARASYQNFARSMLDLFWAARLDEGNFSRWMIAENFEPVRERLVREKRGVVFLGVHQGNWEWGSLANGYLGFRSTVVAENFKNPRLIELFRRLREHSSQTVIPQENSLLRLMRTAKHGGSTAVLIDLNLRPSQAATVIGAFGAMSKAADEAAAFDLGPSTFDPLLMCVPLLHAAIAQRTGALLVPVETESRPDGTCRVTAHAPVEWPAGSSLAEIAQRCWDAYEPIILARPELWLWPYKHFRYRPRAATRPYPGYANESGKFEQLLREQRASGERREKPRMNANERESAETDLRVPEE